MNRKSKKAEINYIHNDGNNDHSEHSFPELKKTIEDEEDRRDTAPFSLLTPLQYCYLVLTLGTLLGLPVSTFTAIIEHISQPEDFWTNINLISPSLTRNDLGFDKVLQICIGTFMLDHPWIPCKQNTCLVETNIYSNPGDT